MHDTLFTERKSVKMNVRLPAHIDKEIRRIAEMDGISINSAIVQRLARCLREERASEQ